MARKWREPTGNHRRKGSSTDVGRSALPATIRPSRAVDVPSAHRVSGRPQSSHGRGGRINTCIAHTRASKMARSARNIVRAREWPSVARGCGSRNGARGLSNRAERHDGCRATAGVALRVRTVLGPGGPMSDVTSSSNPRRTADPAPMSTATIGVSISTPGDSAASGEPNAAAKGRPPPGWPCQVNVSVRRADRAP
jgi:hypothetical protein